jgi:subtilase family serine protease
MLGVFIEPYPVPNAPPNTSNWVPNTTGWARWAGTSFAAPMVSAVLANMIGRGNTAPLGAILEVRNKLPTDPQIGKYIELRQGS